MKLRGWLCFYVIFSLIVGNTVYATEPKTQIDPNEQHFFNNTATEIILHIASFLREHRDRVRFQLCCKRINYLIFGNRYILSHSFREILSFEEPKYEHLSQKTIQALRFNRFLGFNSLYRYWGNFSLNEEDLPIYQRLKAEGYAKIYTKEESLSYQRQYNGRYTELRNKIQILLKDRKNLENKPPSKKMGWLFSSKKKYQFSLEKIEPTSTEFVELEEERKQVQEEINKLNQAKQCGEYLVWLDPITESIFGELKNKILTSPDLEIVPGVSELIQAASNRDGHLEALLRAFIFNESSANLFLEMGNQKVTSPVSTSSGAIYAVGYSRLSEENFDLMDKAQSYGLRKANEIEKSLFKTNPLAFHHVVGIYTLLWLYFHDEEMASGALRIRDQFVQSRANLFQYRPVAQALLGILAALTNDKDQLELVFNQLAHSDVGEKDVERTAILALSRVLLGDQQVFERISGLAYLIPKLGSRFPEVKSIKQKYALVVLVMTFSYLNKFVPATTK